MAGRWERFGAGSWRYSDGLMRLEAELDANGEGAGPGRFLTLRGIAERTVDLRKCAMVLQLSCDEPPFFLDRRMRWRALGGEEVSGELTPLVVRWKESGGGVMELRSVGGTPATRLGWRPGELRLSMKLESAALHPRWIFIGGQQFSTASPARDAGWRVAVNLLLRQVYSTRTPTLIASRFPQGTEAAFTITDHCDFDTVGALRTFLDGDRKGSGWLGRGLRLTKGVFATESPEPARATVPTMHDTEYRSLLERLHRDGSEVAPHGLNERGNITPERFREALAEIVAAFTPRTWIDHGCTLDYCYSMGGAENPAYLLTEELRRHGIHTLWAYQDVPINPVGALNMLALPSNDLGHVALRMGRHLARGRPLVAARYGRSALLAHTTGSVQHVVGRALTAARREYMRRRENGWPLTSAVTVPLAVLADMARTARGRSLPPPWESIPFTREEALDLVPTLYPERAVPLSQLQADDFLLFATMEVLHTEDAYSPAAIERLVSECGLHIAHTYLVNRLPYVAGIFADANGSQLSDAWRDALGALAEMVAAGRLWNPTMGELADWVRRSQRVVVTPVGERAAVLRNPGSEAIGSYTLLLPNDVAPSAVRWGTGAPAGTRRWDRWLAVWGELPASGSIELHW